MDVCRPLRTLVFVLLIALPATAWAGSVPADGLIAYWQGENNYADETAAHDGTPAGTIGFRSGRFGQAFDLGNVGFVRVPDDPAWTFTGDFTISLWAMWLAPPNSGSLGNPEDVFISHDDGGGFQNKWFFAKGGGMLNFHVNDTAFQSAFLAQTAFSPLQNEWYHLAVRRTGDTYQVFAEGAPGASEYWPHAIPNAGQDLFIGQAEGFYFNNGVLDDVAIYDRALTDGEIRDIASGAGFGGAMVPLPGSAAAGLALLALLGVALRVRAMRGANARQ